jgi:hypothetical protein
VYTWSHRGRAQEGTCCVGEIQVEKENNRQDQKEEMEWSMQNTTFAQNAEPHSSQLSLLGQFTKVANKSLSQKTACEAFIV